MPEPMLKIATDFVRIAWIAFAVSFSPRIESDLAKLELDFTDLANVLRNCQVTWSDKQEASDALFEITGQTTEGVDLVLLVRIQSDLRNFVIEEIV